MEGVVVESKIYKTGREKRRIDEERKEGKKKTERKER